MSTLRGSLVAIEGIEGAGKSTQVTEVARGLREMGVETHVVRFPVRTTPVGIILDKFLKGEREMDPRVAHQLFAANRSELIVEIEAFLSIGTCVILDPYTFSGTAYSVAKGLDREWCQSVDHGLTAPDHVFLLTLGTDEALGRVRQRGGGSEIHDRVDLLERVAVEFNHMAVNDPGVWTPVDATLPVETITQIIIDNIEPARDLPIQRLGHQTTLFPTHDPGLKP